MANAHIHIIAGWHDANRHHSKGELDLPKHYETTAFKNTAEHWTPENLRLRRMIERRDPNVNWSAVLAKLNSAIEADKRSGINKNISRTYHLNFTLKAMVKAQRGETFYVGRFDVPQRKPTGRKKKSA